jgi:epoxyqueuosine reductase
MRCQTVCPKNRGFLDFTAEPVEFDEAETALVLAGIPVDELPAEMADKAKTLNMLLYYDPLARNLKLLFDLQT